MTQNTLSPAPRRSSGRRGQAQGRGWRRDLIAGGTEGNERLTVLCGVLLLVLFAGLGLTILRIGSLLWLHMFLGCLLITPIALKLASVGYRFIRYYTGDPEYRIKGPPPMLLRALGPLVVLSTAAVFITGVALLLIGPSSLQPLLFLHKASFVIWIAVIALHVLMHLGELRHWSRDALSTREEVLGSRRRVAVPPAAVPGHTGRSVVLVGALVSGLVIAIALSGQMSAFTHALFTH